MPEKPTSDGFRYFDVVAIAIGILVAAGWLLGPSGLPGWAAAGRGTPVFLTAIWIGFIALRRRAYQQVTPWLSVSFAVLFGLAIVITYLPAPLMWLVVAASVGGMLLLIGLVAPGKPIAEPVRRIEVFKLVTVIVTMLLMVGLAEGFLRTFSTLFSEETQQFLAATPANSGVAHPYIGHLHRPSRTMLQAGRDFKAAHHADTLGFRNPVPWPDRAVVVAVGDSLTFGLNVADEHAWPVIVGQALRTPVVNLGLVGASPEQYFRLYETFGARLQPKLLLVGVYVQNDFWDAGMFDLWLREGVGNNYMVWRNFGRPLRVPISLRRPIASAEGLFRGYAYPLIRSSYLYNLLNAVRGGELAAGTPATLSFTDGSRLQLNRRDFETMTSGAQPGDREFQLVMESLRKIQGLAAAQGTGVLLVLQPGKEEVYLPLAGEAVKDPAGPLRQALDDAGIAYLDLAPVFRERAKAGERLFFEVDSHPNEAGYALIGRSVASHLAQHAGTYGLTQ